MQKNIFILHLLSIFLIAFIPSCNQSASMLDNENVKATTSKNAFINGSENSLELSPYDYTQWVKNSENGLFKEKTIEDITFTAQYKPHEYIICLEERAEALPDSIVAKKKKELMGMQYLDLKFTLNESQGELLKYQLNSPEEYEKRVKYFSFSMQNDIQLVEGSDTIPCSLFHFERAYDVAPFATFLLGFNSSDNNTNEKTLIVHDKTFKKGIIKFTFKKNDLQNLPKLKTI